LAVGFDPELVIPGSDLFSMQWFALSEDALKEKMENLFAGIEKELEKEGLEIKIVGEIGMDHYWLNKNYQLSINEPDLAAKKGVTITSKDVDHSGKLQEVMFRFQLDYALENKLPVSIHSRGAENECISIIREYKEKDEDFSGIFHSFTGNSNQLKIITDKLDFFVGVNGIVTYNSAERISQMYKRRLSLNLPEQSGSDLDESPGSINQRTNRELSGEGDSSSGAARNSRLASLKPQEKIRHLYRNGLVVETDAPYLVPSNSDRTKLNERYGDPLNDPSTVVDVLDYLFR
jgi:Tat protein secretion system quality control protein TatD with DNase activity